MSTETLTAPVEPFPSGESEDREVALNRLAVATGVDEAPEARKHARVSTDVIQGSPATIMELSAQYPVVEDANERLATPAELKEIKSAEKSETTKERRDRKLGQKALVAMGIIRNVGLKTYVADAARTAVENGTQKAKDFASRKATEISTGYHNTVNDFGDSLLGSMQAINSQLEQARKQKEARKRLVEIQAKAIADRNAKRRAT